MKMDVKYNIEKYDYMIVHDEGNSGLITSFRNIFLNIFLTVSII